MDDFRMVACGMPFTAYVAMSGRGQLIASAMLEGGTVGVEVDVTADMSQAEVIRLIEADVEHYRYIIEEEYNLLPA